MKPLYSEYFQSFRSSVRSCDLSELHICPTCLSAFSLKDEAHSSVDTSADLLNSHTSSSHLLNV